MPDKAILQFRSMTEAALCALAEKLAPRLRSGDLVTLTGDLGAGKTTFARALIRALTGRADEEVPSPTYSLAQPYETPRFRLHHFDFYRLTGQDEAAELGLDETLTEGVAIAEWPERLDGHLPRDRLEIALTEDALDLRSVELRGLGAWTARLKRFAAIETFLAAAGLREAKPVFLNGDASARGYTRLIEDSRTVLLMDWPKAPDGPPIRDGLPYSRIAHLAEDVRPFVAVAAALREAGLRAPAIYAQDLEEGLLLIEDFGDLTFTRLAAEGSNLEPVYRLAVDVLLKLRDNPPPEILGSGSIVHHLPPYNESALAIEAELLLDWFLPALNGVQTSAGARAAFGALWSEQFQWLVSQPAGWVLRDYHSPNLVLRPDGLGLDRLGVIDFQDAMRGHAAYDLASLLQDARLDLPAGLEASLLAHYCERAAVDPCFDRAAFLRAYRLLGAQRATKILGIFARLARRDGKHAYLRHIPRIARYLEGNLADPHLKALKSWYEQAIPRDIDVLLPRI